VLNKRAKDNGVMVIDYDKFLKIKKFEGKIYDAEGNVVRKLNRHDIRDRTANYGQSLYQDDRIKIARLYYDHYPYTIEYHLEIEHKGLINWPDWRPVSDDKSVQNSIFQVSTPLGIKMRYKEINLQLKPTIVIQGGKKIYQWQLTNQKRHKTEDNGPPVSRQLPHILTAPDKFQIDENIGRMDSWKTFGIWYGKLLDGRQELPDAVKHKVKILLKGIDDPIKKTAVLYHYMQSTTHYISVQLGIGGWQPYDARYVSNHGYGDCKALTNYMYSLLKAVHITSYPALVSAGASTPDIHIKFPSNQFNHVILCVPFKQDTVWLECTSQTMPFNKLGDFTSNRHVLLITPKGGKLVKTPSSKAKDNREVREAKVSLDKNGNADVKVKTKFTGNQMMDIDEAVKNSTSDDEKKWIQNRLSIPNFNLDKYQIKLRKKDRDTTQIFMKLTLPSYGARMGNRIFIHTNLMHRLNYIPSKVTDRKNPIYFDYPYFDTDSVIFRLPTGYTFESLPDSIQIEEKFGSFNSYVKPLNKNRILYVRHMKINTYRLPPSEYVQYRNFCKRIGYVDKSIMSLVKKE
jgi:hypothetical protein